MRHVMTTADIPVPSNRAPPRRRHARMLARLVLCTALLCSGCTIYIGPYDDTGRIAPGQTSVLPEPTGGSSNEPALDDVQQARKEEAERYTREVIYQGGTVLQSVQLPSGDVLDFIQRDTLSALPYGLPALPFSSDAFVLPPGVEFGLTELEQSAELLELAATATPFHRPIFWPYILGETDATSIEDYLARYSMTGQPSNAARLYAGLASNMPNRGISGYLNQFRAEVVLDSFSLIEFAVACPADGPAQELIGIVISVDKANKFGADAQLFLDGEPRLHIEAYRLPMDAHVATWDGTNGAFVANPFRRHHPGEKVPVSVVSGAQVEHLMSVFQAPNSDWWVTYNGDLLGYYPASMFPMLNGGACRSAWYGEVARRDTSQGNIQTEMGSGKFAETGWLNAAYVRTPTFYDLFWFGLEPADDSSLVPYNALCYDRSPLLDGIFFLGGPGGKNPGCKWP